MFSDRGNFLRQHHGHNMELNKKKFSNCGQWKNFTRLVHCQIKLNTNYS